MSEQIWRSNCHSPKLINHSYTILFLFWIKWTKNIICNINDMTLKTEMISTVLFYFLKMFSSHCSQYITSCSLDIRYSLKKSVLYFKMKWRLKFERKWRWKVLYGNINTSFNSHKSFRLVLYTVIKKSQ